MNQRLRRLRELNSYSQKHIADLLGISQSAYSQIEKGSVALSLDHLKVLCKRYGVSLDWLAWGDRSMSQSDQGSVCIPLVRIRDFNGYMSNLHDETFLTGLPHYSLPGLNEENCIIFEVPGEGLKPHIYPNDFVICRRVDHLDLLSSGSFVLKITDKRIELLRLQGSVEAEESMLMNNCRELWKIEARLSSVLVSASEDQERRISNLETEFNSVKQQLEEALEQARIKE